MRDGFAGGEAKSEEVNDKVEISASEFVDLGIDDLAKYRIVQFLCECPETCGDARLYAEQLGLRPVERTSGLLEELVERRILERNSLSDLPRYKLTADKGIRYRLTCLFALARNSVCQTHILTRLATRSLDRVKPRESKKKRRQPSESMNLYPPNPALGSAVPAVLEARPRHFAPLHRLRGNG